MSERLPPGYEPLDPKETVGPPGWEPEPGPDRAPLAIAPEAPAPRDIDGELRTALEQGALIPPSDDAGINYLARTLDIPPALVAQQYPLFKQAAEITGGDPRKFKERYPGFVDFLINNPNSRLHPSRAVETSGFTKALRAYQEYSDRFPASGSLSGAISFGSNPALTQFDLEALDVSLGGEERTSENAAMKAPVAKVGPTRDFKEPGSTTAILGDAAKRAWMGVELGDIGFAMMVANQKGENTDLLHRRAIEIQQELGVQVDYGANWAEQLAVDLSQPLATQAVPIREGGKAYAAGAALVGLPWLIATKSPKTAVQMAHRGGMLFAKGGFSLGSFKMESGSAYVELLDEKKDDGTPLTHEERAGIAALYGFAAAAVETAAFATLAGSLGPVKQLIVSGERKAALRALMADRTKLGVLAQVGRAWLKASASEGIEEGIQTTLQYGITWAGKSLSAGAPQKFDKAKYVEELGESIWMGTLAGTAMGGAGSFVHAGTRLHEFQRSERNGLLVSEIANLASSEAVRAAPADVARLVQQEAARGGAGDVTHVYLDGEKAEQFFQKQGIGAGEGLSAMLGKDVHAQVAAALAGENLGRIEVPLDQYLEKLGPTGVAKALAPDTAIRPFDSTLRQRAEQTKSMWDEAEAQVKEWEAAEKAKESGVEGAEKAPKPAPAPEPGEAEWANDIAARAVASGAAGKQDAKRMQLVARAFVRTIIKRYGKPAEDLMKRYVVEVKPETSMDPLAQAQAALKPEVAQAAPAPVPTPEAAARSTRVAEIDQRLGELLPTESARGLGERLVRADAGGRAQAYYLDPKTGALNWRGIWSAPADPQRPLFALLDFAGKKPANDEAGHSYLDAAFRAVAQAMVAAGAANPAKVGGSMMFNVADIAEAREILKKIKGELPKWMEFTIAVGDRKATLNETVTAIEDGQKDAVELQRGQGVFARRQAMPREFQGETTVPDDAVDETARALRAPGREKFLEALKAFPREEMISPLVELSPEHVQKVAEMPLQDVLRVTYRTEGGLLTEAGWVEARKPGRRKKYVVSWDMRAIKSLNQEFGQPLVDLALVALEQEAVRAGGADFDAAHRSGDEFSAQSDSLADLTEFAGRIRDGGRMMMLSVIDGETGLIKEYTGIEFAFGIGGTFDEADGPRLLADKRALDKELGADWFKRRLDLRPAAGGESVAGQVQRGGDQLREEEGGGGGTGREVVPDLAPGVLDEVTRLLQERDEILTLGEAEERLAQTHQKLDGESVPRGLDALTPRERAVVEEQIAKLDDAAGIRKDLERLKETPWARQAIWGALARGAMERLMAGEVPDFKSALDSTQCTKLRAALFGRGWAAVEWFIGERGVIGHAEKPGNSVNSSFLNCRPTKACATYCYAADPSSNFGFSYNIARSELITMAVEKDPVGLADRVFKEYRALPEFDQGKALRVFDKGDISPAWLPFFKRLEELGVRTQIFSKRGKILRDVSDFHLRLLSVDSTSRAAAEANPELPFAYVYDGTQESADWINRNKEHVGVVLPIITGRGYLPESAYAALDREVKQHVCPPERGVVAINRVVDVRDDKGNLVKRFSMKKSPSGALERAKALAKKIGGTYKEPNKKDWRCTTCDTRGGAGCFFGRATEQIVAIGANQRKGVEDVRSIAKRLLAALDTDSGRGIDGDGRLRRELAAVLGGERGSVERGGDARVGEAPALGARGAEGGGAQAERSGGGRGVPPGGVRPGLAVVEEEEVRLSQRGRKPSARLIRQLTEKFGKDSFRVDRFGGIVMTPPKAPPKTGAALNMGKWHGRPVWVAIVDRRDDVVLSAYDYEEAESASFHHQEYVKQEHLELLDEGVAEMVWFTGQGELAGWHGRPYNVEKIGEQLGVKGVQGASTGYDGEFPVGGGGEAWGQGNRFAQVLFRGAPAQEGPPSEQARFGPGYYYADTRRVAEVFAEFRGPGARVLEQDIDLSGLTMWDDSGFNVELRESSRRNRDQVKTKEFWKFAVDVGELLDIAPEEVRARVEDSGIGSIIRDFDAIERRKTVEAREELRRLQVSENEKAGGWAKAKRVEDNDPRLSEQTRSTLANRSFFGESRTVGRLLREAGFDGIVMPTFGYDDVPGHTEYVFFKPPPAKVVEGLEEVRFAQDGREWFSPVQEAFDQLPRKRGTGAAWLAALQKGQGVKTEELEAMGLPEWLAAQKGEVAREAVAQYLKDNQIEVTIRTLAGERDDGMGDSSLVMEEAASTLADFGIQIEPAEFGAARAFLLPNSVDYHSADEFAREGSKANEELLAHVGDHMDDVTSAMLRYEGASQQLVAIEDEARKGNATRLELIKALDPWNIEVTSGGPDDSVDFRIVALKDPDGGAPLTTEWMDAEEFLRWLTREKEVGGLFKTHPVYAKRGAFKRIETLVEQTDKAIRDSFDEGAFWEEYSTEGHREGGYRELLFYGKKGGKEIASDFRAHTFGSLAKSLIFWARVNDHWTEDGERVLLIDELQSDLHQKGREYGYDTAEGKTELKAIYAENTRKVKEFLLANPIEVRREGSKWVAVEHRSGNWGLAFDTRAQLDEWLSRLTPVAYAQYAYTEKDFAFAHGDSVERISEDDLKRHNAPPEILRALDLAVETGQKLRTGGRLAPDAPWKGTAWESLAVRHLLRIAAKRGIKKIAWTTGRAQDERYGNAVFDIQNVEALGYDPEKGKLHVLDEGGVELNKLDVKPGELSQYVGKPIADRLLASSRPEAQVEIVEEHGEWVARVNGEEIYSGSEEAARRHAQSVVDNWEEKFDFPHYLDLDINLYRELSEVAATTPGMGAAYDKRLPDHVRKILKPFGGEVAQERLRDVKGHQGKVWTATLPEEFRANVLERGVSVFARGPGDVETGWTRFFRTARRGMKQIFQVATTRHANSSTLLHESAHVFLEMMGDLSQVANAPAEAVAEYQAILNWLGAESRDALTRDQYERFALAFESYLYEGKAPSVRLAGVFARMRSWFLRIGQKLRGAPVELNDDIRGIFDRMLATDAEIAAVRAEYGAGEKSDVFTSPEAAGLTPDQYEDYLSAKEEAFEDARVKVQQRILVEQKTANEASLREAGRSAKEQAEREYEERREARIIRFLRKGESYGNPALRALVEEARVEAAKATRVVEVPDDIRLRLEAIQKEEEEIQDSGGSRRVLLVVAGEFEWNGAMDGRGAPLHLSPLFKVKVRAAWNGELLKANEQIRHVTLPSWLKAAEFVEDREAWEWVWAAGRKTLSQAEQRWLFEHVKAGDKVGAWAAGRLLAAVTRTEFGDSMVARIREWLAQTPSARKFDSPLSPKVWEILTGGWNRQKFRRWEISAGKKIQDNLNGLGEAVDPDQAAEVAEALREEATPSEVRLEALAAERAELDARVAQIKLDSATGRVKLDLAAVVDVVGGEAASDTFRGLTAVEGGVHPDRLGEIFGYETGAEMVRGVMALDDRTSWVDARRDQILAQEHPSLLSERERLQAAIADAQHAKGDIDYFLKQWAIFRSKAGDRGQPPIEAVKRAAAQIVRGKQAGKLNVRLALDAERGAARRAAEAAGRGNWKQAAVLAQQQMLNHYLYRELVEARSDKESLEGLASTMRADKYRAGIGKVSPAIRDAIDQILEATGLRERIPRDRPARPLSEAVDVVESFGVTVMLDQEFLERLLAQPLPHTELLVENMRKVLDALKNLRAAALSQQEVLDEDRRVQKDQAIGELAASAEKHLPLMPEAVESVAKGVGEKIATWGANVHGEVLRPETMIRMLGGDDPKSPWARYILNPLQAAKSREVDLLRGPFRRVIEAFQRMPDDVRKRMNDKVDGRALFPMHRNDLRPPTRRFQLLMLALNAGNQSNLDRLLQGRGIDQKQLQAALATLSRAELEWVQSVWDACEELWPLSRELEERVAGVAPPKLEAKPLYVATKDGEVVLRGGYFPAVYLREVSTAGEKQAMQAVADVINPAFVRPGTPHSHLKGRVEGFADAIATDPAVIMRHLVQVAHDLAFREAITGAANLILDPRTQDVLKHRLGSERSGQFLQWLKDIGAQRATENAAGAHGLMKVARKIRSNAAVGILGYAADVALGDIANLGVSLIATPLKTKWWARGMTEFLAHPFETVRWTGEKSGELRFRRQRLAEEFREHIGRLTAKYPWERGFLETFRKHAFIFMEWSDLATSTPIWTAAYKQAAATMPEAEAILWADSVVRRIFPSHSAVDSSYMVRRKDGMDLFLLFHGYANTLANVYLEKAHQIHVAEGARAKGWKTLEFVVFSMALSVVGSVVADFVAGHGPKDDDKDDELSKEEWAEWFAERTAMGWAYPVPLFGWVVEAAVSVAKDKRPSVRVAPIYSGLEGIARSAQRLVAALEQDNLTEQQVLDILRSLGILVGVPSVRPARTIQFVFDAVQGEVDELDPLNFLSGVVWGAQRGQGLNPATAIRKVVR